MRRRILAGCMALAALGAVTVFDVGASTAEAAASASQFAGSWSGTWSVAAAGHFGVFEWTISDQGRITGTVHNTVGGSGTVVGQVGADGSIIMIGYAPNDVPSSGAAGYAFHGKAVIDGNGKLVASMTGAVGFGGNLLVAVLARN